MGKYQDVVTTYAERVLEGEEPTCKFVKWACQRHLNDLRRSDIVLDPDEILRVCNFVEMLPHTKGGKAGKPLLLEPAQKFILGSVFGWRRKSDGFRRFRYSYTEIPQRWRAALLFTGWLVTGRKAPRFIRRRQPESNLKSCGTLVGIWFGRLRS